MNRAISAILVAILAGCANSGSVSPSVQQPATASAAPTTKPTKMKEGPSSFIEYLGPDHLPRRAGLTETTSGGNGFMGSSDPSWNVFDMFDKQGGMYRWLTYLKPVGDHQEAWQLSCVTHEHPFNSDIDCAFLHRSERDPKTTHRDNKLVFIAPDGSAWQAEIAPTIHARGWPTFTLTKLH